MPEAVVRMLAEWALRSSALVGLAFIAVWGLRIRDVSMRLAAWTAVLAGVMLIPLVALVAPPMSFAVPVMQQKLDSAADAGAWNAVFAGLKPDPKRREQVAPAWEQAIAGIWFGVASLLILRLCGGLWVCRRLVRAAIPIEPGILESGAVTVPVTVGVTRPLILLPPDWRGWDPLKLQAVLAHEKGHVRRRDPARLALAHLYRCVCWFHPLAWWLHAHLADLAEAASDDAALATTNDSLLYAETLLDFFGRTPGRVRLEGVAMARLGSTTRRMNRVLDSGRRLSSP